MSKGLYEHLAEAGLLEYGAHIDGDVVRGYLGLEMPTLGTRAQFTSIALAELTAVDAVRAALLNEGKYITATRTGYRILTPGENAGQIDSYLSQAQGKISRARKLERTTPALTKGWPSQNQARLDAVERGLRGRTAAR